MSDFVANFRVILHLNENALRLLGWLLLGCEDFDSGMSCVRIDDLFAHGFREVDDIHFILSL